MREAELWRRMTEVLGDGYVGVWAESTVLAELGSRTVEQALAAGLDSKRIWLAVWAQLELPQTSR